MQAHRDHQHPHRVPQITHSAALYASLGSFTIRLVGWLASFTLLRFRCCCMHAGRHALIDKLSMRAGGMRLLSCRRDQLVLFTCACLGDCAAHAPI